MTPKLYRAAKVIRENPRFRTVAIPAYRQMTRMMIFGGGRRVLVNSVPKAGTHLLSTLLRHLPGMIHSGQHYVLTDFRTTKERPPIWGHIGDVDWEKVERTFAKFNRRQFLTAHFPAEPVLIQILNRLGFRTLFIVRDPRDVVVSSAFYMANLRRHLLYRRYSEDFTTDHERIMMTITGFPPNEKGLGSESIGERLDKYLGWLDAAGVFSCRFESLIGVSGGGDKEQQLATVEAVARHLGLHPTGDDVERWANRTWSPGSPTFRRGSIGDWRNHFTDEHKAAFKDIAGHHLIALGYEHDFDW